MMLVATVSAKRVEERFRLFSVEIPDGWKYQPPDWSGAGECYHNANGSVSISLKSYDIRKMSLEQWVHYSASEMAKFQIAAKFFDDRLAGVPAKRMEWPLIDNAYLLSWMATNKGQGAGITLDYPRGTKENIKAIRKKLTRSFRWVK